MYEIKFKDLREDKNYVARFENPYQLEQFKKDLKKKKYIIIVSEFKIT